MLSIACRGVNVDTTWRNEGNVLLCDLQDLLHVRGNAVVVFILTVMPSGVVICSAIAMDVPC